jgi:aspartyl-tRNA synthetase
MVVIQKIRNSQMRIESVLSVKGVVMNRPKEKINPKMQTGEIEVAVQELDILNIANQLPIQLANAVCTVFKKIVLMDF